MLIILGLSVQALAAPPNVVLVLTDDQGYGALSCHGQPMLQTPHIDKLHAESVRLRNFHVDPSCAPTRAALLTGKYSARVGVWDTSSGRNILRHDEVTLADLFKKSGYRTAIFGKWHLGQNYPYLPENRGFDESLIHQTGAVGQPADYPGNDYFDDTYYRDGQPEKVQGYCTDVWFRESIRFIEENKNRPFLLYVATNAPHIPYRVSEKYAEPYLKRGVARERALYFGMCANIDENVGRLRRRLRELELDANTVFIFMTDNGGTAKGAFKLSEKHHGFVTSGYNAGMRGGKQSMYEGGHRVPCFVRWPAGGIGGASGRDVDSLTAHFDLLPTLADLCDLSGAKSLRFDGISLSPILREKPTEAWPERRLVVAVNRNQDPPKWHRVAILAERWRLINGEELYDIIGDPGQRHDVAVKHPAVVAQLREWYEGYWSDISERFDEYSRVFLGAPEAKLTMLSKLNRLEDSKQIAVEVIRDGEYEVILSDDHPEARHTLTATGARLRIGALDREDFTLRDATRIAFKVRLTKGPAFVQAWFTDPKSSEPRPVPFLTFRHIGS
jgi:arylsulfatase A-like enzyme